MADMANCNCENSACTSDCSVDALMPGDNSSEDSVNPHGTLIVGPNDLIVGLGNSRSPLELIGLCPSSNTL